MKKILLLVFFPYCLHAQVLPDSTVQKIDNIFRAYNNKTPGCAIAILKNGEVVFQKGYGMANLEYSIPITPTTIFHIASESKQYVAFCMLLLEKEGKLSLDDDIRKYLEYVPDFGHKISIRNLIYHTSGLRDQWQLLANAGWQLDDVITQEHVIKLISKQKTLNYIPGDEWMYCNTGYTLQAEIVKKVTGISLRQYADKNIFQPLGMKDTHFNDDYQELVPNRAYSYAPNGGGYENLVLSYSIVGATSLLTTVLDECKWLNNFETGLVGGKELVAKMLQTGVLNDGRKLNYAFALNIDKFKGWTQIGHGGADAGFRTYACRFPEKNIGIAIFGNSSATIPSYLATQVAALLISDIKEEPKQTANTNIADTNLCKRLRGKYYSERGNLAEFFWEDGKLKSRNFGVSNSKEIQLAVVGNNRYALNDKGPFLILDEKNKSTDSVMELKMENNINSIVYKRQPKTPQVMTKEFVGRYYNNETEAFYTVSEKDGELTLEHRKFSNVTLKNIAPDQFTCSNWWMDHIRFLRAKKGKVTAFEVNSGRILHLKYERVE